MNLAYMRKQMPEKRSNNGTGIRSYCGAEVTSFYGILAYMVELGMVKVGPRLKSGILGHILQAKKSMLTISKLFEILHIYLLYNDSVLANSQLRH